MALVFLQIYQFVFWETVREREAKSDSQTAMVKNRSRKSAKLAVLATTPEEVLDCPLCSCRLERKTHPTLSFSPRSLPLSLSLSRCTHEPFPLDSTGLETSCSLDPMNKHGFTYICPLRKHKSIEVLVLRQKDLFCIGDKANGIRKP